MHAQVYYCHLIKNTENLNNELSQNFLLAESLIIVGLKELEGALDSLFTNVILLNSMAVCVDIEKRSLVFSQIECMEANQALSLRKFPVFSISSLCTRPNAQITGRY